MDHHFWLVKRITTMSGNNEGSSQHLSTKLDHRDAYPPFYEKGSPLLSSEQGPPQFYIVNCRLIGIKGLPCAIGSPTVHLKKKGITVTHTYEKGSPRYFVTKKDHHFRTVKKDHRHTYPSTYLPTYPTTEEGSPSLNIGKGSPQGLLTEKDHRATYLSTNKNGSPLLHSEKGSPRCLLTKMDHRL